MFYAPRLILHNIFSQKVPCDATFGLVQQEELCESGFEGPLTRVD